MLAFVALHSKEPGAIATRTVLVLGVTLSALAGGALCLLRTRWLPGERRIAWALLGAAVLAWGLGGVAWAYQELWQQRHLPADARALPFPSVADAGFLALLPLAAGALLVMVIGSTQATTRLRTFLDGLLITSALVFAGWILFLRDIVGFADGLGQTERLIALAYPVGDVFLIGLLVLVASRSAPQVRLTLAFLGAALLGLTIADAGFWSQVAHGGSTQGNWTDAGWLVGFLLIGYAALRPIPVIALHEAPRPGLWLSALPLAPFVVSTGLATVVQVREGALPPFLFWNAIVVVSTLAVRQFVMVYENLQLRRETEAALATANEAHRLRTSLLHSITHDLQNPLSPIQIQLRLLEGKVTDDVRRRLDIVGRNVEQIKRLVADLGDVAKLQDGRLVVVRQSMDLAAIVRDVNESFQPLAHERGIALHCVADEPLPIEGDPIRLRQVLANLVSNALKFTPRGGTVTQTARREAGRIMADVQDTGRGLTPDEAGRLFQMFTQVHQPGETKERGTGLGLFISRGLAEAHGGTLTVTSPGRGQGSVFRMVLPPGGPAPPRPGAPSDTTHAAAASGPT